MSAGSGRPTAASSASTFAARLRRSPSPCTRSTSAIWSPTAMIGLSAVIGS
jgi:hypothetical protein